MNGAKMTLQNSINGDWEGGQVFHFAVDTCMNFKQWTGNQNCESNTTVEDLLDNFTLITKVSEEFYSAKTYASNNDQVSSTFTQKQTPLTKL